MKNSKFGCVQPRCQPTLYSWDTTSAFGGDDDAKRIYLARRVNSVNGRLIKGAFMLPPFDGSVDWVSEMQLDIGEKRSDWYYIRYIEGPEDARRMAEQDRNYVFELEAEGRLDQVEPNLETEVPSLYAEIQVYRKAKLETSPPGRIKKLLESIATNAITSLDLQAISNEMSEHIKTVFAEVRKQIGHMKEDSFVVPDFVPFSTEEINQILRALLQNQSVKTVNFGDIDLSAHGEAIVALIDGRPNITIQPPEQTIPAINTIGDFIMPKQDVNVVIKMEQQRVLMWIEVDGEKWESIYNAPCNIGHKAEGNFILKAGFEFTNGLYTKEVSGITGANSALDELDKHGQWVLSETTKKMRGKIEQKMEEINLARISEKAEQQRLEAEAKMYTVIVSVERGDIFQHGLGFRVVVKSPLGKDDFVYNSGGHPDYDHCLGYVDRAKVFVSRGWVLNPHERSDLAIWKVNTVSDLKDGIQGLSKILTHKVNESFLIWGKDIIKEESAQQEVEAPAQIVDEDLLRRSGMKLFINWESWDDAMITTIKRDDVEIAKFRWETTAETHGGGNRAKALRSVTQKLGSLGWSLIPLDNIKLGMHVNCATSFDCVARLTECKDHIPSSYREAIQLAITKFSQAAEEETQQERIRQETEERARQEEKERTNRETEGLLERKIQTAMEAEGSKIQEAEERLQSRVEEKTSELEAKLQQAEETREREKQEMTSAMESGAQVIKGEFDQLKEQITHQQAEVVEKFQSAQLEQQTAAKSLYDRQGEAENKHQLLEGKTDKALQEAERKRQEGEKKLGVKIQESSTATEAKIHEVEEKTDSRLQAFEGTTAKMLEETKNQSLEREEVLTDKFQEATNLLAGKVQEAKEKTSELEAKQQESTREIQQELQRTRTTLERSLGVHKETIEQQQAALRTELSAPMTFITEQREYIISNIESAIAQRDISTLKELLEDSLDLRGINLSEVMEQIDGEETFSAEQQIELRSKGAILSFRDLIEDIESHLESIESYPEDRPILKKLYHLLERYIKNWQEGTLQSVVVSEDFDQAATAMLIEKYYAGTLKETVREVLNQELQKDKETNQELWLLDKASAVTKELFDEKMEGHYLHQLRERNPGDIPGYDQMQANIQSSFYARYRKNKLEESYVQKIDNTVADEMLEKLDPQTPFEIQPLTPEFGRVLVAEATKVEKTDKFLDEDGNPKKMINKSPIYKAAITNLLKKWRIGSLEQEATPEVFAEFKGMIESRLAAIRLENPLRESLGREGINILIEQVKAGYRAREEAQTKEEPGSQAKAEVSSGYLSEDLLDILLENTNQAIGSIKAKEEEIKQGLRKLLTIKREEPERLTEEDHAHIDNITQERWNHYLTQLRPYAYPILLQKEVTELKDEGRQLKVENQELREQLAQMQTMMTQLTLQFAQFTGRQETSATEEQPAPTAQARSGAGMF
jgi:hypothetical protein